MIVPFSPRAHLARTVRVVICFFSMAYITTGCSWIGRSTIKHSDDINRDFASSSFFTDKVQLNLAIMKAQSPAMAAANEDGLMQRVFGRAEDEIKIPAGVTMAVVIDTACARRNPDTSFAKHVLGQSDDKIELKYHAYEYRTRRATTGAELNHDANTDPCVASVSENGTLQIASDLSQLTPLDKPKTLLGARKQNVRTKSDTGTLLTPNDAFFDPTLIDRARYMTNIRAFEGWDIFFGPNGANQDLIVAVIDSGVDYTHEDLMNRMYRNAAGQLVGYDFVNNDNDPKDDNLHGTHVAGLIAAEGNNAKGFAGVAWKIGRIMPVKTQDAKGSGSFANIVNGIRYAADNGAHVINMSLGGGGSQTIVRDAMNYAVSKGSTVLSAAGNGDAAGVGFDITNNPVVPASYSVEILGALTIGSIDARNSLRSPFSNFSVTKVDLGAPGSDSTLNSANQQRQICSTIPKGILPTNPDAIYACTSGTSMATPIAAGAALLAIGLRQRMNLPRTPAVIESDLTNGSVVSTDLTSLFKGGKRLDILNLANYIGGGSPPDEPPPQGATPPTFTTVPSAVTVNQGQPFSLTSATTGSATFQWALNNSNIAGATSAIYSVAAATGAHAGTYKVTAMNSAGEVSATALVTVRLGPVITQQPVGTTVAENSNVTLTVVATSPDAPTYQWRLNGTAISGATSATLTLNTIKRNQAGIYTVAVTNAVATTVSAGAQVVVQYAPTFTMQTMNQTVNRGANVTLNVVVDANPAPTYQWMKVQPSGATAAITGQTGASLLLSNIPWNGRGLYQVRATNSIGATNSQLIRIDLTAVDRAPSSIVDGAMPVNEIQRTGGFHDLENKEGL